MIPKLMERLARLEAATAPPTIGQHLVFRVEAPRETPANEIVTFLKDRGHAIHEGDDVFLMNVGAYGMAEGEPLRDLSLDLLVDAERDALPAAGKWPSRSAPFTFNLDSPRGAR